MTASKTVLTFALSLVVVGSAAAPALAQDFPTRPIRIIVGFPPGGSNDLLARMLATKMSERIGKQVVVDNRAGASGIVASEITAASPPDGHTLMLVSVAHTANPALRKLKYDTEKSFDPVAKLGSGPAFLVVHPSVQATSVKELVDFIKANPGKLNMAHAGPGTYQHMASSQFLSMASLDALLVPFKGGGPALIDVLSGNSHILLVQHATVASHIKSGKLRLLAVSSEKRIDTHPELPTVSESGVPGYTSENWWGIVGPAGLPKAIVDKLIAEMHIAQDTPEFKDVLEREGARAVKTSAAEFGRFLSAEIAKWAKVVKDGNITVD